LSSKTPAIALRDIVEAIGWIETFTAVTAILSSSFQAFG